MDNKYVRCYDVAGYDPVSNKTILIRIAPKVPESVCDIFTSLAAFNAYENDKFKDIELAEYIYGGCEFTVRSTDN